MVTQAIPRGPRTGAPIRWPAGSPMSARGPMRGGPCDHSTWGELLAEQERSGQAWREFLRASSLSMGVYNLRAGQDDPQRPHTEDEVYYVIAGRARFRAGRDVR